MAQKTITSFFNSRKRPAVDDLGSLKTKIAHIERTFDAPVQCTRKTTVLKTNDVVSANASIKHKAIYLKASKLETNGDNVFISPAPPTSSKEPEAFGRKNNASNVVKNSVPKCGSVISARSELSLGDIRKKLAGSSRLAELKAAADRLSKGIQQLKESSEKRNLKDFKSIDVDVPISPKKVPNELLSPIKKKEGANSPTQRPLISPRKVVVSPVKSPNKVPAYIRHAALASPTSLPLPHHYRFLAELFRGMETVVALLFNRNEKITFNKLKPSIQEMLKRTFSEKHLAQIKQLVPDFYNYEIQKIKNFSASTHKEIHELVISPNFPNDIKNMNPSILLERRRYFYDTLLQLVKKHHAQYLSTLDPPMDIPDNKLVRWHPEFELEKVPDIECAKLPEMPNVEKLNTAQDVLAKARELFKCNTKMERALEKLAQAKARGLTAEEQAATGISENGQKAPAVSSTSTQTNTAASVTILNPALRNLPSALLEKVKAKQAAKALEAMTKSSENEQKYFIYSRLPDLAKTLRNIFVTERKNVLALNIILSKLDSSFKANVSASDLQRDLKLLSEVVPGWIKFHEIRNTTYIKLDKVCDLKQITTKLEAVAVKYKDN